MLLVIVNDLHVRWSWCSIRPFEANAPLVVDPNAVLALTVANQGFKAIPWKGGEIAKRRGSFHPVKLETRRPFKARKRLYTLSSSEVSAPLASIADYHSALQDINVYALRQAYRIRRVLNRFGEPD